jgi:hypothetical protein
VSGRDEPILVVIYFVHASNGRNLCIAILISN